MSLTVNLSDVEESFCTTTNLSTQSGQYRPLRVTVPYDRRYGYPRPGPILPAVAGACRPCVALQGIRSCELPRPCKAARSQSFCFVAALWEQLRYHGSSRWFSDRIRAGGSQPPKRAHRSFWSTSSAQEPTSLWHCLLCLSWRSSLWLQSRCFQWCPNHDIFQRACVTPLSEP